jgi:hypothetical protein
MIDGAPQERNDTSDRKPSDLPKDLRPERYEHFVAQRSVVQSTTSHDRTLANDCQIRPWALLLLALSLCAPPVTAQTGPIIGRWQLDATESADAADELKGIRVSKRKKRPEAVSKPRERTGERARRRYWQEANAGHDWRHTEGLAHAGPLQRLLESDNLEIVPNGSGFVFIYADGYERDVVPNPSGRIFTASGDELVRDEIGYTLAFWDDARLVLETRIKGGGKLIERISTSADGAKLTVEIEIDRRDWKWIAKLQRVFVRA